MVFYRLREVSYVHSLDNLYDKYFATGIYGILYKSYEEITSNKINLFFNDDRKVNMHMYLI